MNKDCVHFNALQNSPFVPLKYNIFYRTHPSQSLAYSMFMLFLKTKPKAFFCSFSVRIIEKLQFHFNEHIFKLEQEQYKSEGVSVDNITFEDNQPALDLIEKKRIGIIAMIDVFIADLDKQMQEMVFERDDI